MKRFAVAALASVAVLALAIYVVHAQRPSDSRREAGDRPDGSQDGKKRGPGGRDGRRQRGAAQQVPTKIGVVTEFTKNPEGETDGLRLDDGTEVRFL